MAMQTSRTILRDTDGYTKATFRLPDEILQEIDKAWIEKRTGTWPRPTKRDVVEDIVVQGLKVVRKRKYVKKTPVT